jgi:ABC-2 type transport system permease protein
MTTTAIPFSATFASEWTKLTTLRSTYVTVALSVVLAVVTAALAAMAIGLTWDDWSAADRQDFDPILYPLVGSLFAAILLPMLGVKAVASEYSTGMIRLTLTATPRRSRVLLAKTAAVAAVTLVAASVATVGMFFAGQVVYRSYGLETAGLGEADALRAIVGSSVLSLVFPVIAVALAVLLRSTVGAITTVLAFIFAPGVVGSFLPSWWQENVVAYLPGEAGDSIAISHLEAGASSLPVGVAVLVVAAWLAAFLGAAYVVLMKRDA